MVSACLSYRDFQRLEQASWHLDLRSCPAARLQTVLVEHFRQDRPGLAEQVAALDATATQMLHTYLVRRRCNPWLRSG